MCAKAIHSFILRRCCVDFAGVSSLFVLDFCLQRYQLVWSHAGGGGASPGLLSVMLGEQHSAPLPHEWLSSYGFQVRGFSDGLLPLMFANIGILGKTFEEKSSFPFINSQIYSFKTTSIKTYSNPVRHFALFCCFVFFLPL